MHAIHYAHPRDLTEIVNLINLAYLVERHFVSGPRIGDSAIAERIAAQEMLILRASDRPVATAHVRLSAQVGHLGLVSVHPDAQGCGLGKRIIAVAEGIAAARGANQMRLQVVNLREELPEFYRRLGYRECGTSSFDETKSTLKPVHFIDMAKSIS